MWSFIILLETVIKLHAGLLLKLANFTKKVYSNVAFGIHSFVKKKIDDFVILIYSFVWMKKSGKRDVTPVIKFFGLCMAHTWRVFYFRGAGIAGISSTSANQEAAAYIRAKMSCIPPL